jgi:hypothetical protein
MKKVRVLQIVPNPKDVTSFYRATGVTAQILCDFGNDLDMTDEYPVDVFDDVTYRYHLTFIQRPYHDVHYEIAKRVKRNNRKLWIDFDDDLFSVPIDNPCFNTYADFKVRANLAEIIMMADVITVTTEYMKNKLLSGSPDRKLDIRVIPNAFDFERFIKQPKPERNKLIMWRGTPTHTRDILSVAHELVNLYKTHTEWEWEFLGDKQWMVTESMIQTDPKRCKMTDNKGIMDYHDHILDRAPKLFIVPLHFNTFNRSKSNIAFLEATYAGALCLAPDMAEWQVPGCINYTDAKDFSRKFEEIIAGKHDEKHDIARHWVKEHRSLKVVNRARVQIIKELAGVP